MILLRIEKNIYSYIFITIFVDGVRYRAVNLFYEIEMKLYTHMYFRQGWPNWEGVGGRKVWNLL